MVKRERLLSNVGVPLENDTLRVPGLDKTGTSISRSDADFKSAWLLSSEEAAGVTGADSSVRASGEL